MAGKEAMAALRDSLLSQRPDNLHKISSEGSGSREEVDIEAMITRSGCSKIYYDLEECLGEHDRDWRKCQREVRALKVCNDIVTKNKNK